MSYLKSIISKHAWAKNVWTKMWVLFKNRISKLSTGQSTFPYCE